MGSLRQGKVIQVLGDSFVLRTRDQKDVLLIPNGMTRHNGWPAVGENVVAVVEDNGKVLVMTRYICRRFRQQSPAFHAAA